MASTAAWFSSSEIVLISGCVCRMSVEHRGANDYGGIRQEFSLFRHVALCGVKQSDSTLLLVIVTAQNCAAVSFFKLNRGRANKHRIPLN